MTGDSLAWIVLIGWMGLPYFVGAAFVLVTVFLLVAIAMRSPMSRSDGRNKDAVDDDE